MPYRPPQKLLNRSRELRRDLTPAESRLWQILRSHRVLSVHFRRQHAIGPYIVDFCAPTHHLIIEVDGSPHLDQPEYDLERTAYLEAKGYKVLRFWNSDVIDTLDAILDKILHAFREA